MGVEWPDWISLVEISSPSMVMLDTACLISAAIKACVQMVSLFSSETYYSYSDIIVSPGEEIVAVGMQGCLTLVSGDICLFRCWISMPLSTMKTCL